jgi:hypothetical protein
MLLPERAGCLMNGQSDSTGIGYRWTRFEARVHLSRKPSGYAIFNLPQRSAHHPPGTAGQAGPHLHAAYAAAVSDFLADGGYAGPVHHCPLAPVKRLVGGLDVGQPVRVVLVHRGQRW